MLTYSNKMVKTDEEEIVCESKCCHLVKTMRLIFESQEYINDKSCKSKSGILILDSYNRILLSQSYNYFWGIPKGTIEPLETSLKTCIRETKEETGIDISLCNFEQKNPHLFFIKETLYIIHVLRLNDKGPECINPSDLNSESTGCGWVNINCLFKMVSRKKLKLNFVTKQVLEKISFHKWIY